MGDLTIDQMLDLLGQIDGVLDEIESNTAQGGEGTTDAFVRSSRITEVQGSRLIAIEDTQLVRLTQIRDLLASGTMLPASSGAGTTPASHGR